MQEKNLYPTTDAARPLPASPLSEPRWLSPCELSAVTGGKGDDDYGIVHVGPGYLYSSYGYLRHPGIHPGVHPGVGVWH